MSGTSTSTGSWHAQRSVTGSSALRGEYGSAAIQRRVPSESLLHPLLTVEQYQILHEFSEHSSYYINPALILKSFPPSIAASLLAVPLTPREGEYYTDADGFEILAYERNLTVDQFIRQWFLPPRAPHSHVCGMQGPLVPISPEEVQVIDWNRPAKISRPESHESKSFEIQNIPWSKKLKVSRDYARAVRDKTYNSYRNLKYTPHCVSVVFPLFLVFEDIPRFTLSFPNENRVMHGWCLSVIDVSPPVFEDTARNKRIFQTEDHVHKV